MIHDDSLRLLIHSKTCLELDLGGTYRSGVPSRSLYNFRILLAFCDEIGFQLAEDFYWFNPAKLPSELPAFPKKLMLPK